MPRGDNRQVRQSGWAETLQRAMGGTGTPLDSIDQYLQAGLTLDDLTRPEYWWLRRGQLNIAWFSQGAVVGERGFCQFRQRTATTPLIAVVEQIVLATATGSPVIEADVTMNTSTVGGVDQTVVPGPRDTRHLRIGGANATESGFLVEGGTDALPVVQIGSQRWKVPAEGVPLFVPGPWIVEGDGMLQVIGVAPNLPLRVTWYWRERQILPNER